MYKLSIVVCVDGVEITKNSILYYIYIISL